MWQRGRGRPGRSRSGSCRWLRREWRRAGNLQHGSRWRWVRLRQHYVQADEQGGDNAHRECQQGQRLDYLRCAMLPRLLADNLPIVAILLADVPTDGGITMVASDITCP